MPERPTDRAVSTLRKRYPPKHNVVELSVRLPDDVHGPLSTIAKKEDVPLNGLIVELLRGALEVAS